MVMIDFSFRSLTAAQSGRSVLNEYGIGALLSRAPQGISELGCGYVLEVLGEDGARTAEILKSRGIGYRRIFRRYADGGVQEVRYGLF